MQKEPFKIYGINRSSDAGPDKFAFSLFLKGCNLRCPYCMNCDLVKNKKTKQSLSPIPLDKIKEEILDAKPKMVVISGGEPTSQWVDDFYGAQNPLKDLKEWLKQFNCKIAISTNGTNDYCWNDTCHIPNIYSDLSYVILDFKGMPKHYYSISRDKDFLSDIVTDNFTNVLGTWNGLRYMKKMDFALTKFDYEIRTTLYPPFIDKDSIKFMSNFFLEGEKWILQPFRHTDNIMNPEAKEYKYSQEEVDELFELAKNESVADVSIRYV